MTLAEDYRALTQACGLVDMRSRTRLELRGEDRATFLHNMCTNEIRKLAVGRGCEAFLTDARGHVLGHVFVFCRPEALLVETVPEQEERLLKHLDRYIIRERVELAGHTADWSEWLLAGAQAAEVLERLVASALPDERLANVETLISARPVTVARVDWTPGGGFVVFCQAVDAPAIGQALVDAGAIACAAEAWEVARVQAGLPLYGRDIHEKSLPQEVARDALAISFVKGCYIGQETVARLDALGHVNKTLVRLKFTHGAAAPPAGMPLRAAAQIVGEITSGAYCPGFDGPLALGYVKRGANQAGAVLESDMGPATVLAP